MRVHCRETWVAVYTVLHKFNIAPLQVLDRVEFKKSMLEKLIWIW